jgi:hypothetical protein
MVASSWARYTFGGTAQVTATPVRAPSHDTQSRQRKERPLPCALEKVTKPKRLAGLSVLDLERFNKVLRLRWTDTNRPWHTLPPSSSPTEAALFWACTEVHLGDGKTISFWHNRWVAG